MSNSVRALEQQIFQKRVRQSVETPEDTNLLRKKLRSLELNLQKIQQKHNQASSDLRSIRKEVDIVRRERVVYDSVFKKLEHDIKQKE